MVMGEKIFRFKRNKDTESQLTWKEAREQNKIGVWVRNYILETLIVALVVVVIICFVKTFLVKGWFHIPSGSMENTLQVNDQVMVNVAETYFKDPERGDIVVFKDSQGWMPPVNYEHNPINDGLIFIGLAPDTSVNYLVKRVIGVPGDTVESDGKGKIRVNGAEINEPYIYSGANPSDVPFKVKVPEGKYFMMGDHRNKSADSRFHIADGKTFVQKEDILGPVFVIVAPADRAQFVGDADSSFRNVPNP